MPAEVDGKDYQVKIITFICLFLKMGVKYHYIHKAVKRTLLWHQMHHNPFIPHQLVAAASPDMHFIIRLFWGGRENHEFC